MPNQGPDFPLADFVTAPAAAVEKENTSFPVKLPRLQSGTRLLPLRGYGLLVITPDEVQLSGEGSPFGLGPRHSYQVPHNAIRNVQVILKRVELELLDEGKWHRTSLLLQTRIAAASVAALLSPEQTPEFARRLQEKAEFQAKLDRLNPVATMTWLLTALNILMFLVLVGSGVGFVKMNPQLLVGWGANFGPLTLQGQYWRLLTGAFLHAGLAHIFSNMLVLYRAGPFVERVYGSLRFLLIYLFAGITGGMVSVLWRPGVDAIGASGAICGMLAALLVYMLNPRNAIPRALMARYAAATAAFLAYSIYGGFHTPGVDNGAHIGGLIGGAVMGALLAQPLDYEARRRLHAGQFTLAAVVGLVLILGLGHFMLHPQGERLREKQFSEFLFSQGDTEQKALMATNQLMVDLQLRRISPDDFALQLEQKACQPWASLSRQVAATPLDASAPLYITWQAMGAYTSDRQQACRYLEDGVLNQDVGLIRKSTELNASAVRQLMQLREHFKNMP